MIVVGTEQVAVDIVLDMLVAGVVSVALAHIVWRLAEVEVEYV